MWSCKATSPKGQVSRHAVKFDSHRHCRYNGLLCDLVRTSDWRVIWLYRYEPPKISQYHAKFSSHRHCGSEDVILDCHQRAMLLYG